MFFPLYANAIFGFKESVFFTILPQFSKNVWIAYTNTAIPALLQPFPAFHFSPHSVSYLNQLPRFLHHPHPMPQLVIPGWRSVIWPVCPPHRLFSCHNLLSGFHSMPSVLPNFVSGLRNCILGRISYTPVAFSPSKAIFILPETLSFRHTFPEIPFSVCFARRIW